MTPPILGIWASQISGHLWAPAGAYDALATVTVPSGGAASVDFNGIPQGYKHLQIRALARLTGATADDNILLRFNTDSGNNYAVHWLTGSGISATSNNVTPISNILAGRIGGASSGANMFGVSIVDILDYASTTKNKTTRTLTGHDENGSGSVWLESGLWLNTSAVTSIKLLSGSSFAQHSSFALYGIK